MQLAVTVFWEGGSWRTADCSVARDGERRFITIAMEWTKHYFLPTLEQQSIFAHISLPTF